MSAGRLQLYDRRAGPRDRTSRLLVRVRPREADGAGELELRLREFGSKQAAWVKLLPSGELEAEESLARLGPEAWPDPPDLGELLDAPRPLHAALRDQRVIAGIGRSWADEILWEARAFAVQARQRPAGGGGGAAARGDRHDARPARSSTTSRW